MNSITGQLEIEDLTDIPQEFHSILMFDPSPIYDILYKHEYRFERQIFSHYKRINTVEMSVIFPNEKGICACGCGKILKGRSTRWVDRSHTYLALTIQCILAGRSETIRTIIAAIYGYKCSECGIDNNDAYEKYYRKDNFSLVSQFIELDHIIPVHQGGGGCWLGNYQLLCRGCHKEKSKRERKTNKMRIEINNYICHTCKNRFNWGEDSWSYGQIDEEDKHIVFCSTECKKKHKK